MTSDGKPGQDRSDFIGPRIVVGVDGCPLSMRALDWAAAEAELPGAALQVVHVDFATGERFISSGGEDQRVEKVRRRRRPRY